MSVREYVGARYVPIVVGEWDNSKTYEPLMVVTHVGNSYTSRQYVPAGIDIANESYWVLSANYNAQVEQYRTEVKVLDSAVSENTNQLSGTADSGLKTLIDANTNANATHTNQLSGTAASGLKTLIDANTNANATHTNQLSGTAASGLKTLIQDEISAKSLVTYYGADPTGIKDSSDAIQNAIENNKNGAIYFPSGTYLIEKTIKTYSAKDNWCDIIFGSAVIKTTITDSMIFEIGGLEPSAAYEIGFKKRIIGGFIDASSLESNYAIGIHTSVKTPVIDGITILTGGNGIEFGIGGETKTQGGRLANSTIIHTAVSNSHTGVMCRTSDNKIINTFSYYFMNAFYCGGSTYLDTIHTLKLETNENPTTGIFTVGSVSGNNIYIDSDDIGIRCTRNDIYNFSNVQYYSYIKNEDLTLISCYYTTKITISNINFTTNADHNNYVCQMLEENGINPLMKISGAYCDNFNNLNDGWGKSFFSSSRNFNQTENCTLNNLTKLLSIPIPEYRVIGYAQNPAIIYFFADGRLVAFNLAVSRPNKNSTPDFIYSTKAMCYDSGASFTISYNIANNCVNIYALQASGNARHLSGVSCTNDFAIIDPATSTDTVTNLFTIANDGTISASS